jgi:hypothetical protein
VFKGSGFYLTDYGKNAHRGTPPAAKPTEGGKSESGKSESGKSESGKSESGGGSGGDGQGVGAQRPGAEHALVGRVVGRAVEGVGMTGADRIRAELRRAAAAIGADDGVDVVLERPRDRRSASGRPTSR